ncbi:MAG: exodeoxyribonuclease VII large subunit [Rikenellaceae bacterium]
MNASQKNMTLSQLQGAIQDSLAERFSIPVWVSAEISDIKVNATGHCYLELVEKGESDGLARAQARGVIWRSAYQTISANFEAQTGGQRLERGMTILACVSVSYHELYGLSLQIVDIDPTYTIGEVERQRQEAIERLKANGSWDKNRGLELPMVVKRVAIISSRSAAGYQDFARELAKSAYHIHTELFEAAMQGATAEQSIIDAMVLIANRREEFDAVAVIRGGGSTNDLSCFNTYRLALHFANFPRPVIAGIGHDKDVSVVDMVAQVTVKTPTAVAVWLNDRMLAIDSWLQGAAMELNKYAVEIARQYELKLESYEKELVIRCDDTLTQRKKELLDIVETIPEATSRIVEQQQQWLANAEAIVQSFDPKKLLEIGFAIARSTNSKQAITSAKEVKEGDSLLVELADATIEATVKSIAKR